MTNLQALQSICPFSANTLLFSKVLADNGVTEGATYDSGMSGIIELCSAYVAKVLYISPDINEGGLAVTYDKDKLRVYANGIFQKNNLISEIINKNKISII